MTTLRWVSLFLVVFYPTTFLSVVDAQLRSSSTNFAADEDPYYSATTTALNKDKNNESHWGIIQSKYQGLPPKGKFIAMAATGFIGSRLVMDLAATSLKIAGVTWIVSEVLHHTGALDNVPGLSEEQRTFLMNARIRVLQHAETIRMEMRRRLNPDAVQHWFARDTLGALGLAAGSLMGTIL